LAYLALEQGGTAAAALNAANEVAVNAFLAGELRFDRIAELNESVLDRLAHGPARCLDDVLEADAQARAAAGARLARA
jgi:1-deoxy-D-xylulose-5-phosphate reductoisomerase